MWIELAKKLALGQQKFDPFQWVIPRRPMSLPEGGKPGNHGHRLREIMPLLWPQDSGEREILYFIWNVLLLAMFLEIFPKICRDVTAMESSMKVYFLCFGDKYIIIYP